MAFIAGGFAMSDPEPILLKKFQLLEVVSVNRNLKGCDFAVFWQIQDHYNQKLGYAYPSFNRLALRTGFSKRNIQNSVSRLVRYGFIEIILHGSRNNVANRYKPNYELLNDWLEWRENYPNSELGVWKHSSIGNKLEVWNASSEGMEAQFQSYGSVVPSNPSINPSINEGLIVGLNDKSLSDAALASPLTGLPLASKEKYRYPEFWNVYPMRKHVSKAEDEITAMLSNGVLLAHIVEGARLYGENVKVKQGTWKGGKDYTIQPQNFIAKERWRDDWTLTPLPVVEPKAEVKKDAKVKNSTVVKRPKRVPSQLELNWDAQWDALDEHIRKDCRGCIAKGKNKGEAFTEENLCDVGLELLSKYSRLTHELYPNLRK